MKLTCEINDDMVDDINKLQKICGNITKKELFENALNILQWAVKKIEADMDVGVIDKNNGVFTELSLKIFDNLKQVKFTHQDIPDRDRPAVHRLSEDITVLWYRTGDRKVVTIVGNKSISVSKSELKNLDTSEINTLIDNRLSTVGIDYSLWSWLRYDIKSRLNIC